MTSVGSFGIETEEYDTINNERAEKMIVFTKEKYTREELIQEMGGKEAADKDMMFLNFALEYQETHSMKGVTDNQISEWGLAKYF